MASYRNRSGKFEVVIRRKGITICKSFSDKETAELFAKYKEDLLDEMEAFEVPKEKLITLETAISLRIESLQKEGASQRYIVDMEGLFNQFQDILTLSLSEITFDLMKTMADSMLSSSVKRGGSKAFGGKIVVQSPATVRKKFANLSSVLSYMQRNGIDCPNNAYRILGMLLEAKKGSNEKD